MGTMLNAEGFQQLANSSWQKAADSLQRIARSMQEIPAITKIGLATCY
jgi:hypothetical protein